MNILAAYFCCLMCCRVYQIYFQLPRMYADGKEGLEGCVCRLYLKALVHERLFSLLAREVMYPHYLIGVSFV